MEVSPARGNGIPDLIHSKRYEVLGAIGEGGMGRIFHARDPVLERDVALKVLKPGVREQGRLRFRREAVYGARFCHPSIARVFDMGISVSDGEPQWFTMELLRGTDMEDVIERERTRPGETPLLSIVDVFRQILAAIQYAHDCGVVHRDVKPANMMVTRDPNTGFVTSKLLDFGIALELGGPAVDESTICGDPRYMAPEQTRLGLKLDHRADIYAAGLSFYEVVTGHHPYAELLHAPLHEMLIAQREAEVPAPSERLGRSRPERVARAIDEIVAKACAKRPADRFESARDMQQAICSIVRGN